MVVSKQEDKESRFGMGGCRWSLLEILPRVLDAFIRQNFFLCLTVCLFTAWLASEF